ncbi:MAG TPA: thymidine phosphorylase [Rhizomicrobium sp.]|nr:thymidine phosphorylase [Rhizomicrobium sp.]
MLPQEIIRKKRDGAALTDEELGFVVRGICGGGFSEGQVAGFAMAVFFRGMNARERVTFTRAMTASGTVLRWDDLKLGGPVLDKHSTGGVGDKVSIMLAPLVAACGGFVPMISGRGLGHTGGTLDKLGAIPGYRADPDINTFRRVVQQVGCAIIGQTAELAPADKRLYAVRDVTATVESIPLISASILSKKLAAGLEGLVMDVKTGSGAFMEDPAKARMLAKTLVSIGQGADLPVTALLTDMDEVLGESVGHALEMDEVVFYLTGRARDPRLHEVTLALAAEMLCLGKLTASLQEGKAKAQASLDSGKAAEVFSHMVAALGGPSDYLEKYAQYTLPAKIVKPFAAPRSGILVGMDCRAVGVAAIGLGGGRRTTSDVIDLTVGFTHFLRVGTKVEAGDLIALVHARNATEADAAIAELQEAVRIGDEAPMVQPVISARITAQTPE